MLKRHGSNKLSWHLLMTTTLYSGRNNSDSIWTMDCGGVVAAYKMPAFLMQQSTLYCFQRHHPITPLLVQEAHLSVKQNGVKEKLTELREKFWIIKGHSLVRLIIHHCVLCRRFEGLAYKAPPPLPLPACRVKEEPPFYTGVDFAECPLQTQRSGCVYTPVA